MGFWTNEENEKRKRRTPQSDYAVAKKKDEEEKRKISGNSFEDKSNKESTPYAEVSEGDEGIENMLGWLEGELKREREEEEKRWFETTEASDNTQPYLGPEHYETVQRKRENKRLQDEAEKKAAAEKAERIRQSGWGINDGENLLNNKGISGLEHFQNEIQKNMNKPYILQGILKNYADSQMSSAERVSEMPKPKPTFLEQKQTEFDQQQREILGMPSSEKVDYFDRLDKQKKSNLLSLVDSTRKNVYNDTYKPKNSKTRKADEIIKNNADNIKRAAEYYGVDPVVVAACIYTEQMENVNVIDYLFDELGYKRNTSLGIGQVQIKTAKEIEDRGYVKGAEYKYGDNSSGYWEVPGYGNVSGSREKAISKRLTDDQENIRYVAAYLRLLQDIWKGDYPAISKDPVILATLYNNGSEKAHSSPRANPFGVYAGESYDKLKYLLGM